MNKIVNTFAVIGVAVVAGWIYKIGYEAGTDDANRENFERFNKDSNKEKEA